MEFSREGLVKLLLAEGYIVKKINKTLPDIPDKEKYKPFVNEWSIFSPWDDDPTIQEVVERLVSLGRRTLVSRDRLWVLMNLTRQALNLGGEIWEAGVYQGGTACLLHKVINESGSSPKTLRLFDTFQGMPQTDKTVDKHNAGDFSDTDLDSVRDVVGKGSYIDFRKGFVPETFAGLENRRIALAHIDLDIYSAIYAACEFIYPILQQAGFMVFDDYGFHTCPGARKAVDEFFASKIEVPLCLPTGQAIVFKNP
jgi:O-methyltransferase